MVKKIIWTFCILSIFSITYGSNCGGNITCNCGDTITSNYIMKNDLNCHGNGLTLLSNVELDCNGHKIKGNGTSTGINFYMNNYIQSFKINKCNIQNFKYGILFGLYSKKPCFYCSYSYYYPRNSIVNNNILSNNTYGIYLRSDYNNVIYNNNFVQNKIGIYYEAKVDAYIYNNSFENNLDYGIYTKAQGKIWANTFSDSGIYQQFTAKNSFCQNNVSNTYLGDVKGPKCNCIIPLNNMFINSNVKFCNGTYYVPKGINLGSNVDVDCNNSTLIGNRSSNGITNSGESGTIIKNCNLANYTNGIVYQHRKGSSMAIFSSVDTYWQAVSNDIYNTTIFDVVNGVVMTKYQYSCNWGSACFLNNRAEHIHNSTILADNYNIYSVQDTTVNVTNNWWGTANETLIESKLQGNIIYNPYKLTGPLPDLLISPEDIKHYKIGNTTKLNIKVKNKGEGYVPKFDIKIIVSNSTVILKEATVTQNGIYPNSENNYVINLNISEGDFVHIILDPENKIEETNELNNYAKTGAIISPKYYLDVDTSVQLFYIYENYLKDMLGKELFVRNKSEADIIIYVGGEHSEFKKELGLNEMTLPKINAVYESEIQDKQINNKEYVQINAQHISGYVFGVKEFVRNIEDYITPYGDKFFGKENEEALTYYDTYVANCGEGGTKCTLIQAFVENMLYDKMYYEKEGTIPVLSPEGTINYRYKLLGSLKSDMIKSYIDKDQLPIMMGRGLWSNIDEWKDFGTQLANEGYNVYLIELTGGPESECDNCYNYPYSFLTDEVYPAYVNFVLNDSGKSHVKYVGFSNGARTPLDSLTKGEVNPNKVDVLVLAGVPGAFEKLSFLANLLNESGDVAIRKIENKNITHVTFRDVFHELDSSLAEIISWRSLFDNKRISVNLAKQYYNWINNFNDVQPGSGLNVNYFTLIYGNDGVGISEKDDKMVAVADEKGIYNNVNNNTSYKKIQKIFNLDHANMPDNRNIFPVIRMSLNKEIYGGDD